MAARRVIQLYFGKRDDDLWEVIQNIREGDRNHEIRQALRNYFMNENNTAPILKNEKKKKEDPTDSINIGLNTDLIR